MSSRSAGALWAASGRGLCFSDPAPGRRGPLLPGWVPGVRSPCGGSASGRSAERRVWVAWPRRHLGPGEGLCPARGEVPSIRRGECREVPGLPPAKGAVRRAVPSGHERDGVRVGFLMPKAAGDSSMDTGIARGLVARGDISSSESFQRPTTVQPQVPNLPQCKHRRG